MAAVARHQTALLARDPGPLIGYTVMGVLLMVATRPLYGALGGSGTNQAAAGMAVMFSLFALKVAAAHILNERLWNTADRLRSSPAGFGEILLAKSIPLWAAVVIQQVVLLGFAEIAFGLHPRAGWWALIVCVFIWSGCVLLLGLGAATLARSTSQLSAAGDIFALLTTVLGGAIVPTALLPAGFRQLGPLSPGHWALAAYDAALTGTPAQLIHPLLMLGVFGALGVGISAGAALFGSRPVTMRRRDCMGG
jgi:ABC-2 type transport system permease protein